MNRYRLYLLGAPHLERNGHLVQADTRKATALLAYLAVTGQPQSRDTLAALLWPDFPQTNARAALRRTISALHRSIGEPILEIQQDLLALPDSGNLWVDLWEFRRSLAECERHGHAASQVCPDCIPWLDEAASLYADSFMAGFTLRDSAGFDDWQFFQSDALRRELAEVLEKLVNGCAARGEHKSAISYCKRWLSLDALHEPAHRQLMLLYASSDQRTAALRQYQECVSILDKELGVAPLEETRQLFEDIKNGRETQPAAPLAIHFSKASQPVREILAAAQADGISGALSGQNLTSLPLTGRDAEWDKLQQIYSTIQRNGRLAILEGEAGIGKTRLSNEFIALIRQAGAGFISATCYSGESNLALAPFMEGLSRAIEQPASRDWHGNLSPAWLSEAARLLPGLSRLRADLAQTPYSESPGAQTRFFEGLRQVILALCGTQPPGALFLDDIQWADETSLDLLSYLVRRLPGSPLLVLVTWRGEDLDAGHHLRRMLAEAQRSGLGEIIQLSRLKPESIEKLVVAAAPDKDGLSPALGQRIYTESEGLPFFVVEYLASMTASAGASAQAERQMPHGVRDLLHSRLEQIGEAEWQLLQAAAVIGRSFDFESLRETSGRTDEETTTTLERLISRGLITEVQTGNDDISPENQRELRYDFSHHKLRELVYSETSQARKRLLHARCAEALVTLARRQRGAPVSAGQVAYHFRQGGKVRQAAEFYLLAGEQARALYANTEALSHFQNALALGHPEVAAVDEAIGDMLTLSGKYIAAIQSYQAALAQQMDSPAGTAHLDHKLGEIHHRLGEWEQAERYFQACAETLKTSTDTRALSRLYADWSRTAYQRGDLERACQMAQRALDLAEQAEDRPALAQALNVLGILARQHGELQQAIGYLERSLVLAVELAEPTARIAALNNLSLAYAEQGNHPQAIEYTLQALNLCALLGDRHHEAALHNNLADLYHASGQEAEAMSHLKKAVVIFSEVGQEGTSGLKPSPAADRSHPEIWKLTEW